MARHLKCGWEGKLEDLIKVPAEDLKEGEVGHDFKCPKCGEIAGRKRISVETEVEVSETEKEEFSGNIKKYTGWVKELENSYYKFLQLSMWYTQLADNPQLSLEIRQRFLNYSVVWAQNAQYYKDMAEKFKVDSPTKNEQDIINEKLEEDLKIYESVKELMTKEEFSGNFRSGGSSALLTTSPGDWTSDRGGSVINKEPVWVPKTRQYLVIRAFGGRNEGDVLNLPLNNDTLGLVREGLIEEIKEAKEGDFKELRVIRKDDTVYSQLMDLYRRLKDAKPEERPQILEEIKQVNAAMRQKLDEVKQITQEVKEEQQPPEEKKPEQTPSEKWWNTLDHREKHKVLGYFGFTDRNIESIAGKTFIDLPISLKVELDTFYKKKSPEKEKSEQFNPAMPVVPKPDERYRREKASPVIANVAEMLENAEKDLENIGDELGFSLSVASGLGVQLKSLMDSIDKLEGTIKRVDEGEYTLAAGEITSRIDGIAKSILKLKNSISEAKNVCGARKEEKSEISECIFSVVSPEVQAIIASVEHLTTQLDAMKKKEEKPPEEKQSLAEQLGRWQELKTQIEQLKAQLEEGTAQKQRIMDAVFPQLLELENNRVETDKYIFELKSWIYKKPPAYKDLFAEALAYSADEVRKKLEQLRDELTVEQIRRDISIHDKGAAETKSAGIKTRIMEIANILKARNEMFAEIFRKATFEEKVADLFIKDVEGRLNVNN